MLVLLPVFAPLLSFFVGMQVDLADFRLLTGKYHFNIGRSQWVSYVSLLVLVALEACIMSHYRWTAMGVVLATLIALIMQFACDWMLSHIRGVGRIVALTLRFVPCLLLLCLGDYSVLTLSVIPFAAAGLYVRQCPFGVTNIPREEHGQFFAGTVVDDIDTWCRY